MKTLAFLCVFCSVVLAGQLVDTVQHRVVGESHRLEVDSTKKYGTIVLRQRPVVNSLAVYVEGLRWPREKFVDNGRRVRIYVDNETQNEVMVDYATNR